MGGRQGALWTPLYPGTAEAVQGLSWVVGRVLISGHPYTLAYTGTAEAGLVR